MKGINKYFQKAQNFVAMQLSTRNKRSITMIQTSTYPENKYIRLKQYLIYPRRQDTKNARDNKFKGNSLTLQTLRIKSESQIGTERDGKKNKKQFD